MCVSGEKHFTLSLPEIFNIYRQRFDIEHFFRFGKNKLLLNKLQTPDSVHEETWWHLVMIAYVQLYLARKIDRLRKSKETFKQLFIRLEHLLKHPNPEINR